MKTVVYRARVHGRSQLVQLNNFVGPYVALSQFNLFRYQCRIWTQLFTSPTPVSLLKVSKDHSIVHEVDRANGQSVAFTGVYHSQNAAT